MSKEPLRKKVLHQVGSNEQKNSYGSLLWNVINIREIVLDYSQLSHENYRFLIKWASDSYLKRRLFNLSKSDMITIYQKRAECSVHYDLGSLLALYSTFRALYGESLFRTFWSEPLPSQLSPFKCSECEIAFDETSVSLCSIVSAYIKTKKSIDIRKFLDTETESFCQQHDLLIEWVEQVTMHPDICDVDGQPGFVNNKLYAIMFLSGGAVAEVLINSRQRMELIRCHLPPTDCKFNALDVPKSVEQCSIPIPEHETDFDLHLETNNEDLTISIYGEQEQTIHLSVPNVNCNIFFENNCESEVDWDHPPIKISDHEWKIIEKCTGNKKDDFDIGIWNEIDFSAGFASQLLEVCKLHFRILCDQLQLIGLCMQFVRVSERPVIAMSMIPHHWETLSLHNVVLTLDALPPNLCDLTIRGSNSVILGSWQASCIHDSLSTISFIDFSAVDIFKFMPFLNKNSEDTCCDWKKVQIYVSCSIGFDTFKENLSSRFQCEILSEARCVVSYRK